MNIMGIIVRTSPVCKRRVPVRVPKTGNKRIQKKWIKRYGTKDEYITLRVGNNVIVVHPDMLATFKKELVGMRPTGIILDDIP